LACCHPCVSVSISTRICALRPSAVFVTTQFKSREACFALVTILGRAQGGDFDMQLSKPSNKARQRRPRTGPAQSAAPLSPSPHPNPTQPRMPQPGNAVPPPETASRRRELPFFARLAAINLLLVTSFSEIQICQ
jgi:hypothetical protein